MAYGHAQSDSDMDSDDRLTANPGRLAVEPLQQFGLGWCLGAFNEVENTLGTHTFSTFSSLEIRTRNLRPVHHLHTFLHTGSGLYNPLQRTRSVSRPHILYNTSTTVYSHQSRCRGGRARRDGEGGQCSKITIHHLQRTVNLEMNFWEKNRLHAATGA